MKLIINAEITKGYETWKNLFLSVDHIREKYGVKVLAYGHPKENEDKVYQVLDVPSMETMQEALWAGRAVSSCKYTLTKV